MSNLEGTDVSKLRKNKVIDDDEEPMEEINQSRPSNAGKSGTTSNNEKKYIYMSDDGSDDDSESSDDESDNSDGSNSDSGGEFCGNQNFDLLESDWEMQEIDGEEVFIYRYSHR